MAGQDVLYHAAVVADWEARTATHYVPAGYADEGFVHCSSADQLVATLHKHYPGRGDLVLLTIDHGALASKPIWEDLYGSGVEFPHVYSPIELSAIVEATPLPCDDNGRFDWWHTEATDGRQPR
ncbi:MAG: DUF952 domain-containing protein [Acidimicrobiales bacterium]